MVTAALFVVAPRLLLALANWLTAVRLRRRLRVPHDFYVRRILRDASGRARTVRVIPYSLDLTLDSQDRLKRLLVEAMGEKTAVDIGAVVPYGDEDEWLRTQGDRLTGSDQLILLFNLASTPEAENHGAMVASVREKLGRQVELTVLLDDTAFVHKLRGQASARRRVDERLQAWRTVLAPCGVEPVRVSLDRADDAGAARSLEQALLRSGATP
jgi:hypothetical protein